MCQNVHACAQVREKAVERHQEECAARLVRVVAERKARFLHNAVKGALRRATVLVGQQQLTLPARAGAVTKARNKLAREAGRR